MVYDNFVPEIWSQVILKSFNKNSVMAGLVNRDYEGEIKKAGDVVHIRSYGSVTVRDYTRSTAITYETLTDPKQMLTINQQKYFAFRVDDLDVAQADIPIIEGYTERAAIAVRDVVDAYLYNHYLDIPVANIVGGASTVTAITKANIYDNITLMAEMLDSQNVPQEDRVLIVNPRFKRILLQSDAFMRATSLGDQAIQNGFLGNVAGFQIYVSTNVPTLTGGVVPILAFQKDFITLAAQVNNVEHIRPTDMFAHAVRGLYLFGSKAVRPEAGAWLRCTMA
ncbi:MAG: P22 coat protein - protein 5 domain protein [Vampirovibrio sp.]